MNAKALTFAGFILLMLLIPLARRQAQGEGRAVISGKITDRTTSAPLTAEIGLAVRTAKGIVLKHARANEQGEYSFTGLPTGEFYLSTKYDGYAVERSGFSLQADEMRSLDWHLVKAVRVNGLVTDARRHPLAEARIQFFYEKEAGFNSAYQWEEGDARTDTNGRFTAEAHPDRAFVVQASSRGFLSAVSNPQLAGEDVTLRLKRGVAVRGSVTDEAGNPLPDVQVQLQENSLMKNDQTILSRFLPFEALQQTQLLAVTSAEGAFRFEKVSEAEHVLIVRHPEAISQRMLVDVTRKNEFAITLNRASQPMRKERRQP